MKATSYVILLACLYASCKRDDEIDDGTLGLGSKYILLNEVDGRGNLSIYDYRSKTLTENFYTISSSGNSSIQGANESEDHLYISAGGIFENILRKINISTGEQVKEVRSWLFSRPFIDFYGDNVVVSNASPNPFSSAQNTYAFVKIYDENLVLKDSLVEDNVIGMYASRVVNNMLYRSVLIKDKGFFIKVMDLDSRSSQSSIEVSNRCNMFIPLGDDQLLMAQPDGLFILDLNSLIIARTIKKTGIEYAALDTQEKILYVLVPASQPSSVRNYLYMLDLATEDSLILNKSESVSEPIMFDNKEGVIVTGGGLKIFSKSGDVLEDIKTPPPTSHIFIK